MPTGKPNTSPEERFLKRCINDGDCILWNGGKYTNGYGQVKKETYGTTYAHQWACHFWNGSPLPIEKGMCIKHSCDNRLCVNPEHLSYGTLQENIQEMVERNPNAMGRIAPTDEELILLRQLVSSDTPRREMARILNHGRHWIDRVRRDYKI
jgi:hypothetical protein